MTTAAPSTGADLAELVGENGPVLDDKAQAAIRAYVQNSMAAGLDEKISQGLQAGLADFYRDQEKVDGARPALSPADVAATPGAVLDGKFSSTGDLFAALYGERKGNRAAATRLGDLRNAYSTTTPSEGGFLVPEEFRSELLRIALEKGVVRQRARVIPMAQPRIKFPAIDSTSNASSVYGGVIGYFGEESAALTASSAKFNAITLDAQKLTGYTEIPNELLADSAISVSAFIDQVFPEALAWFEDVAFFRGTGVGEPLGFQNAACKVDVAKETGQAATTIVWENLVKMFARMLPTSLDRAVWIAHIDTFPELATMALSVGTGGAPIWLTDGTSSSPMSILGRPVIFTEKSETLGTVGDIVFADLGYYLIGDRQQMSAQTSEHFKFSTDTTAYRIIQRLDGRPWLQSAITPNKGSNTLSPIVRLATR